MNLILNTNCQKNCSFCFAKNTIDPQQMTMEDVGKIIALAPGHKVKLLGGEPTIHPQFLDFLQRLSDQKRDIVIISNFLFSQEVREGIKKIRDKHQGHFSFLSNVSEMTEDYYSKVIENIKGVGSKDLRLGYTLDISRPFDFYKKFLDRFYSDIEIEDIRVSLPFPNPSKHITDFYFYKKYEYVDLMIEFIRWGIRHEKKVHLDCAIYPCMIKDGKTEQFIQDWMGDVKYDCWSGIPRDFINKSSVQYCYPGKNVKINTERHKDITTIDNELFFRGRWLLAEKMPKECQACEHLDKKCSGPCLGFLV